MNEINIFSELVELLVAIVISLLVINHFRKKKYPPFDKYHTFWPRFWSPTIDGVILWPIISLIPLALSLIINYSVRTLWVISTFTCLIQFLYSIYFNGRYGGTIGKLKCKLRILDAKTENPISYKQALLRDAVPMILLLALCSYSIVAVSDAGDGTHPLYISAIFGLWFLAEILTMLTNSRRRALHDYIAGTVVVRTNIMKTSNQLFEPALKTSCEK